MLPCCKLNIRQLNGFQITANFILVIYFNVNSYGPHPDGTGSNNVNWNATRNEYSTGTPAQSIPAWQHRVRVDLTQLVGEWDSGYLSVGTAQSVWQSVVAHSWPCRVVGLVLHLLMSFGRHDLFGVKLKLFFINKNWHLMFSYRIKLHNRA